MHGNVDVMMLCIALHMLQLAMATGSSFTPTLIPLHKSLYHKGIGRDGGGEGGEEMRQHYKIAVIHVAK